MSSESELEALRAERQLVWERVTWWETHRVEAMIPLAMGSFGVGFGLAYLIHKLFGAPREIAYFTGVAALFVLNRVVDQRYSVRRLDEIEGRIGRAERALKRQSLPKV